MKKKAVVDTRVEYRDEIVGMEKIMKDEIMDIIYKHPFHFGSIAEINLRLRVLEDLLRLRTEKGEALL